LLVTALGGSLVFDVFETGNEMGVS